MIARITGSLARKSWPVVIVDVGGVGYELQVPLGTYEALPPEGERVTLEVVTSFRNETLQLFGFATAAEKRLFGVLLGVTGVGPRLALAVLSKLSPAQLARAVADEEPRALESVPGIGRKTARRLLLELKDRLPEEDLVPAGRPHPGAVRRHPLAGDGAAALESLGYRREVAERTVGQVLAAGFDGDLPELIRASLRRLGGS
ncbi:MAG: Holliday junction branch migration protein RuvA [Acidobacteria bacterium]|nr:MAG: Holliday junction branch migration protein RuvA [Acidobacteriota bacterium]